MSQLYDFTVVLDPQPDGGFTVRVPALPEVITEGDTETEALAMAEEAIRLVLAYRLEHEPDNRPGGRFGYQLNCLPKAWRCGARAGIGSQTVASARRCAAAQRSAESINTAGRNGSVTVSLSVPFYPIHSTVLPLTPTQSSQVACW